MQYQFREIEKKWQQDWIDKKVYEVKEDHSKPKCYVLDMFPYPSGAGLHVGHPLGYIASDIYARYKRLKGFNVLHPMGFDSFGLPAEQYAIETGQHPTVTTEKNINRYKEQLRNIGFCFDWSREVKTSEPDYYRWTQWIFLQLYSSWYNPVTDKAEPIATLIESKDELTEQELMTYRLAYRAESYVNWCEALGTVLANDEVVNGVSERGGHPVERKLMSQWFLRITAFAERLLKGLELVDFPESLKEMQKNWIGKSEGAEIHFKIKDHNKQVKVFTTRPDTIFGVSFMVLAPEHELVDLISTPEQKSQIEVYQKFTSSRSERERLAETKSISGCFTGAYALHPFTGKEIPIWISEYVLAGYGTGAIMAVPCGDERDYAFAKHFNIDIPNIFKDTDISEKACSDKNVLITQSDFISDLSVKEASKKAIERIEELKLGVRKINYRMRDAGFSRQRYWGEPFPVLYNQANEIIPSHA
ncbi:MAG: leucine--tRNA ligase, partial [Chitinophagaceae bacterium]|nr:leucine--tRNA ligase [Chitinophagaceae bacterium]